MYWGPQPVGMVIGGALGSTVGLRATLWIAAAGAAVSMVPLVLNPIRRLETVPEELEDPVPRPSAPGPAADPA